MTEAQAKKLASLIKENKGKYPAELEKEMKKFNHLRGRRGLKIAMHQTSFPDMLDYLDPDDPIYRAIMFIVDNYDTAIKTDIALTRIENTFGT